MKTATVFAVIAMVFGIGLSTTLAAGPYDAISEDNPAFTESGHNSWMNVHNNALRFGSGGGIAIPGMAGDHADDESVVNWYDTLGSGALVRPMGF